MAKDGTARGGARIGSGRKSKALTEKIETGNPGGRKLKVIQLPKGSDLKGEDIPDLKEYLNTKQKKSGKKRQYSNKHALTSLCNCTRCGDVYRRLRLDDRGKAQIKWKCCIRIEKGPLVCDAPMILESELHEAVVIAINQVLKCSKDVKDRLKENIEAAIAADNIKELEALDSVISEKQKELLSQAQAKRTTVRLLMRLIVLRKKEKSS